MPIHNVLLAKANFACKTRVSLDSFTAVTLYWFGVVAQGFWDKNHVKIWQGRVDKVVLSSRLS